MLRNRRCSGVDRPDWPGFPPPPAQSQVAAGTKTPLIYADAITAKSIAPKPNALVAVPSRSIL
jgi:hypothetical protein